MGGGRTPPCQYHEVYVTSEPEDVSGHVRPVSKLPLCYQHRQPHVENAAVWCARSGVRPVRGPSLEAGFGMLSRGGGASVGGCLNLCNICKNIYIIDVDQHGDNIVIESIHRTCNFFVSLMEGLTT